jgi:GDP/UDP-N,N'-diacetylbacillosamine 2-epimerase (hydrolysing)
MERPRLKIGVLTSTRADFGIYQPLLKELYLRTDQFETELIVFGTHLSRFHGYTRTEIESATDFPIHEVFGMPQSDTPTAIANAYGTIVANFSQFWASHAFDVVFALGDRYEMSAAVQAGIPKGVKFAHLHGGETTLGAIDNIYRHQITLASCMHFTATAKYAERVKKLVDKQEHIYVVGALSLDGINSMPLPAWDKVRSDFRLPKGAYVLITFHPETVSPERNEQLAIEMLEALSRISQDLNLVITMPNADTAGSVFRHQLMKVHELKTDRVSLVESFGKLNYFSAMNNADYLLGNTSSGIIEAASFGKYAVNVGNRQKGRERSPNVIDCDFDRQSIIQACELAKNKGEYAGPNAYYQKGVATKILDIITQFQP